MRLTIELVPETSWFNNVRSMVAAAEWDRIRREVYRQAGYKCEICGGVGPKWPVEAHEIWEYDDDLRTQTLKGMIALCPDCHQVKHVGLAQVRGLFEEAVEHLSSVNKWDRTQSLAYITEQRDIWERRSQHPYTIDVSLLKNYGINNFKQPW